VRDYRPIDGVRVIGLCGHARHGKDETARLLLRLCPGAERFAFSDALAVEARVHHGMTTRDPRTLQDVGMDMRESHPGVWLDALYGAIEDRRPELAVITGVRFPDEAAMVRAMGGQVIRVVRLGPDGRRYVSPDRPAAHRAEAEIDGLAADGEITAATLAELRAAVSAWALPMAS
jgi:hypothetical protein